MAHSGISATTRPTKLNRFWLLTGEPLIISDLGKCSGVKRCEPRSGIRRNAQILVPNLTFDIHFWSDPRGELQSEPLRLTVRSWYLEFNRKISPRYRTGYQFGVRKSRG